VFTRYGTERSRTVIEATDITETLRDGVWNQGQLFRVWHEYRRALTSSDGEHPGWLTNPAPRNQTGDADDNEAADALDDVIDEAEALAKTEAGRGERIRLLSVDGISDPRNDRTPHNDEYTALYHLDDFPDTFRHRGEVDSGQIAIEEELKLQQTILRELEGQQPYPAGLPN
jgi:hypothetical protein